jgi:hypothetical protein
MAIECTNISNHETLQNWIQEQGVTYRQRKVCPNLKNKITLQFAIVRLDPDPPAGEVDPGQEATKV